MARLSKEDIARLDALRSALRITECGGIEALRKEVEWRGALNIRCPLTKAEAVTLGRQYARNELQSIACALATTLTFDFNMPPSEVRQFLRGLNDKMDLYRQDKKAQEEDEKRLNNDAVMLDLVKKYMEEE